MRNLGKRAWLLPGLGLLAVPVAAAGVASACTGLATVNASPGAAAVGESVTITGKGFAPHGPTDVRNGPAEVRMDDQRGPVLATVSPSAAGTGGNFSVRITVPQIAAGEHVIIVTQNGTSGQPAYGTPARQVFTITPSPSSGQPPGQPASQPASQPVTGTVVTAQPADTPAAQPAGSQTATARGKAIARCKKRYSAKKAKTRAGKKRMAKRRAACITRVKSQR